MSVYLLPAVEHRAEISVSNSRFIATIAPAFSVDEARAFIQRVRGEFPDASHHVPAYIIGHGAATTAHCSDAGEPSGTAGKPALRVLFSSGLGDVALVVTRYFGGTKLGTNGLVRAYGEAARTVLSSLPIAQKIQTTSFCLVVDYSMFDRLHRLIDASQGEILNQEFTDRVTIHVMVASELFENMQSAITETTQGAIKVQIIGQAETIIPVKR